MKRILSFALLLALFLSLFCVSGARMSAEASSPESDPSEEYSVFSPELTVTDPTADNFRVFYEIFVGSFSDSNGDGVGDLRGIINRMDYLNDGDDNSGKSLGVEGLWLTPIFASGSYHKYDVDDFYTVDPQFGTLEDLKELVELCHQRNVKLILDLPINHTSVRNDWFLRFTEAHRNNDPSDPFYEFYSYYKGGETAPAGRAFERIPGSNDYYECNFYEGMPELNFDCADVRQAVLDVAAFYLELGVDGFRFDAAKYIYMGSNSNSTDFWVWYLEQLRSINPELYTIGEVWDSDRVVAQYYAGMNCFNFNVSQEMGLISLSARHGDVNEYTSYVSSFWNRVKDQNEDAMFVAFIANHDTDRAAEYLHSSDGTAQMAANLLILGPGSPFLYYGEELGMLGYRGFSNTDANRRLAMVWGDGDTVEDPEGTTYPSLRRADDTAVNQLAQSDSLYTHYKKLIQIRKANPEIARGDFVALTLPESRIGGFCSVWNGKAVCVLHNTGVDTIRLDLAENDLEEFSVLNAWAGLSEASLANGVLTIGPETSAVLRTEDGFSGTISVPGAAEAEEESTGLCAGVWSVIGSFGGTYWDTDLAMAHTADNVFERPMYLDAGDELKVRMDGSWAVNFGADGLRDGVNLLVEESGYYTVRLTIFDEESAVLELIPISEPAAWSVIGTIYDTYWDTDFPMFQVAPNVYALLCPDLRAGQELKVRKDASWAVNFGSDGSRNGPNAVIPADGDYLVQLTVIGNDESAVLEILLQHG